MPDYLAQLALELESFQLRALQSEYDIAGRIDDDVLQTILAKAGVKDASKLDVFMCGPSGFIASMEDALTDLGVKNIEYETF